MRFTLNIKMDNAAFADDYAGSELAWILRELSEKVDACVFDDGDGGKVRDANGNTVGEWVVVEE